MRERLALLSAVITSVLVLAMSGLLAVRLQSDAVAGASSDAPTLEREEEARLARGRALFFSEGCAGCHSVGGEGNPRGPLDGVAARRSLEQLRDFAFGTGTAAQELPRRIALAKSVYAELSEADREAILAFLESLH